MFAFKSDIGKIRERNEDSTCIIENDNNDFFMLVFDGMGGHKKGDVASRLAEQNMVKEFKQKKKFYGKLDMYFWLKKLVKNTNKLLNKYSSENNSSRGMGTTFSCFLVHNKHTLMCYIGDTRCYLINNNKLIQKSIDETYVEFLYETGQITKEEKLHHPSSNVITNALGCYSSVKVNLKFIKEDYDYLLLCSDGLYNMVNDDNINEIVIENDTLINKIDKLINIANENGGRDNIAIALYSKGEL